MCRDIGGVSVHRAVEYGSEACGMRDVGVCAMRGKWCHCCVICGMGAVVQENGTVGHVFGFCVFAKNG